MKAYKNVIPGIALILILMFLYITVGIISVEPIGAVPEGATIIYWRLGTQMPFYSNLESLEKRFNNDDPDNQVTLFGVSLGRIAALKIVADIVETNRVIVKF